MSGTVLILDDSLTVRMDLADAFSEAGLHPIPCATAADARAVLARHQVDVVVLDVLLPDAHGVEFLRELRSSPTTANVVVLMLSTEAEVRDRIRGIQTGADEYIGKPYDPGFVVARARELTHPRGADDDGTTTVLVIDDSATYRNALQRACEDSGYRVLAAATGSDGLRLAASRRPDAIVVDGVLPDIDGTTVVRRVRLDAALRGTPCLLLTGSEDHDAELRALDSGADAFVRKEDDVTVVLAKLAAIRRAVTSTLVSEATPSLLGPKQILAVDDSITYLQELADRLRGEGYDVVMARSGEEALDLVAVQSVDCILLDLVMPGLGGQETCRMLKSAPMVRGVPLIMLTAVEDRGAMIEAIGAGADDYIPKSSEFEVLAARLRAQLRRKQFEDESRRVREELLRREIEATEARGAAELAETRATLIGELERKNKELEAFSYSVSHDLRAPLRSIDGFSQALLDDYADRLDEDGEDMLRRVRGAAQRMGDLIDDMLELSRVGRAELCRDRVDLSELAYQIATELEGKGENRRVAFDIQPDLVASADARLLRIALENLLGNAWKFTANVADATIRFATTRTGQFQPAYYVRDNGDGFDMKYADKLFHPFQRLHREADFPGTGIGLATVHRIIDRHGGRVWAEAEVGKGATIYFTIPSTRAATSITTSISTDPATSTGARA